MAQKIEITFGSPLCGSPINVAVTAESVGSRATFHSVKLVVKAALNENLDYEDFVLGWPASDGEIINFDISSALRSKLKEHQYDALESSTDMPYIKYTLQAYDELMSDGIFIGKQGVIDYGSYLFALAGSFTEVERYLSNKSKNLTKFSRKPESGEVCNLGDIYLSSAPPSEPITFATQLQSGPTVEKFELQEKGIRTIHNRKVYVEQNPNRWLFQFINGLGVIETASCLSLESLQYEFKNERNLLSIFRQFKPKSTRSMSRYSSGQIYKMSTGPVNREWADWWCNEFLCCPASWVRIEGKWFPCTIEPEEEVDIYDRTEESLISIAFTMQPDFSGGFLNLL